MEKHLVVSVQTGRIMVSYFLRASEHPTLFPRLQISGSGLALVTAGLNGFNLYSLRHTHATLLLANGENAKVASERLGHSTIVLTLDTYSHVLPDMQQQAAERIENLLFKTES